MKICPECGKGIDEHFRECPNCGYPFNGREKHMKGKICPDCGREVPKEEKECPYCGFDFEQAEQLAQIKQQAEEAEAKARLAASKAKAAEEKIRKQKQKQRKEETQRQLEEYQRRITEAEAKEQAAKERIQKASAEEKDSFEKNEKEKSDKVEKPENSSRNDKACLGPNNTHKSRKPHEKKNTKKRKHLRNIAIVVIGILALFIVVIAWLRAHPHLTYVIDNEGLMYAIPWNSTEYEVEQKIEDTSEPGTWNNSANSHKYVISSPYFLAISGLNSKISFIFHKNTKNVMVLDNATIEFSAEENCKASKSDVYQKLKDQYDERFGKSSDGIDWDTEKSKIKISGANGKGNDVSGLKVQLSERNKKDDQKNEQSTISPQNPTEEPKQESSQEQSESSEAISTPSDENSTTANIDWDHVAVVPGSCDDEEMGSLLWTNGTVYGIPWYSTYSELPDKVKQWGQVIEYDDLTNYICEDRGTFGGIPGTHVEFAMIFGGSPGTARLDFASITISKDSTCEYDDDKLLQAVLVDLAVRYGQNYQTSSDGSLVWKAKSGSTVMVQYDKNHNLNISLGVSKSS